MSDVYSPTHKQGRPLQNIAAKHLPLPPEPICD